MSVAATEAEFEVAIVGLGPTGAVLANLLGQRGITVCVVEREPAIYRLPRAAHYDGETMRVFQALGLLDEAMSVSRAGTQGMHFKNAEGQTLLIREGNERPGPHGYANSWYFHQPELEALLRERLRGHSSVSVRLGETVQSLAQDANGVTLSIATESGPRFVRAGYAVGCDGGQSLVRRTIRSEVEDLGLHQPWLCLDLIMKRDAGLPPYTVQWCDPARPMTLVNMAGERRRWEIMLMPGDDPATVAEPDTVWPMLSRWVGPDDAEIERSAIYTFHSLIARTWRERRLLLAGDAAHQTPPFLGQGMCAGVRDASNLAWKLERVIRGKAPVDLLDTYESERHPHVRAFIELAMQVGEVIQTTDPDAARERDRRFAASGTEIFSFPTPQLGTGAHTGGPVPVADVFHQPTLADGRRLDDAVGYRFAFLHDAVAERWLDRALRDHLRMADVVTMSAEQAHIEDWLTQHRSHALLIRPDRYVAGLAASASDLPALLACLHMRE